MRRATILALIATTLLGVPAHAATEAAPGSTTSSLTITRPHYKLKAFRWNDNQIRVVTFVGGRGVVAKTAMAYPTFSSKRITSQIGTRSGALVAVNGGFPILGAYSPKHLTMIDGEIVTTGKPMQPGWVLTSTADGTQAWISRPKWGAGWGIHAVQGAVVFDVVGWNAQQPRLGHVVAFSARGGEYRRPTVRTCSALLTPISGDGTRHRVYEVLRIRKNAECDGLPLQPPADHPEQVVLAGKRVQRLVMGEPVQIEADIGYRGVTNAFGGIPRLVKHGVNVGPRCGGPCVKTGSGPDRPLYAKNPRTAVGISAGCSDRDAGTTCRWFVVTVDGRQPGWSEGLRFPPLARLLLQLGAHNALNLDGGGSTAMWVRTRNVACQHKTPVGCLVNRTSYGERPHIDALVVTPA